MSADEWTDEELVVARIIWAVTRSAAPAPSRLHREAARAILSRLEESQR